jgi:hypothetical protein
VQPKYSDEDISPKEATIYSKIFNKILKAPQKAYKSFNLFLQCFEGENDLFMFIAIYGTWCRVPYNLASVVVSLILLNYS